MPRLYPPQHPYQPRWDRRQTPQGRTGTRCVTQPSTLAFHNISQSPGHRRTGRAQHPFHSGEPGGEKGISTATAEHHLFALDERKDSLRPPGSAGTSQDHSPPLYGGRDEREAPPTSWTSERPLQPPGGKDQKKFPATSRIAGTSEQSFPAPSRRQGRARGFPATSRTRRGEQKSFPAPSRRQGRAKGPCNHLAGGTRRNFPATSGLENARALLRRLTNLPHDDEGPEKRARRRPC